MKNIYSGIVKLSVASFLAASLLACGGADERKLKYLEKGKVYLEDKNYEKARIELKNVLQIDPKFAEAYFLMGQISEGNGEYPKALGNYLKAIDLNKTYTEAKLKVAKIYVIAGTTNYLDKAKELLVEINNESPDSIESELISITIEYKTGFKEKAISRLEKLVEENINYTSAISMLAAAYGSNNNHQDALGILNDGVANNPKNIELRVLLSKQLVKNNDLIGAEKHLKKAIDLNPENYNLQRLLSSVYLSSGEIDKAESVLRNAISQEPEDVTRYLVLVEMLSSRVNLKAADDALLNAIKNNPEMYELKFAQAKFYEKIGKRKEAVQFLKEIVKDKSFEAEGVKARNSLARILLEDKNYDVAKKYVKEVLSEHPNNSDSLLINSKLALVNKNAINAINGLRTVLKFDPKNAEASLLLAQAFELNNESALAENELKKSIESNPVNNKAHMYYARFLAMKGRANEAMIVIDNALSYFKDDYDLMDIKLRIVASQGDESKILDLLNMMEKSHPDSAKVNINKGKFYQAKRDSAKAIEEFEKAYLKADNKFESLKLIVQTYVANNQSDTALKRLQINLDKDLNDAVSHHLIGLVYLTQNKKQDAIAQFNTAIKSSETWFVPYAALAAIYIGNNQVDMAVEVFNEAIGKVSNKEPAQLQLAAVYEKNKLYSKAIEVYQNVLRVNPSHRIAVNNLVSLLLDFGQESDIPRALELSHSLEKFQESVFQDTVGWAHAKSGNNEKAIAILTPIVEKSPEIAVYRYHLGYALFAKGDKAAAKSHFEIVSKSEQVFAGKEHAVELLGAL